MLGHQHAEKPSAVDHLLRQSARPLARQPIHTGKRFHVLPVAAQGFGETAEGWQSTQHVGRLVSQHRSNQPAIRQLLHTQAEHQNLAPKPQGLEVCPGLGLVQLSSPPPVQGRAPDFQEEALADCTPLPVCVDSVASQARASEAKGQGGKRALTPHVPPQ